MGLINWIFDIYQHSKLDEVRREAAEARLEAARLASGGAVDGERLERVVGQLALANKTLQRLLVEKGVITRDELRERMLEIDREDGSADGLAPV